MVKRVKYPTSRILQQSQILREHLSLSDTVFACGAMTSLELILGLEEIRRCVFNIKIESFPMHCRLDFASGVAW